MDAPPLNEEEMTQVYNWVDEIPLSRPKKSINRDFADGVLMAQLINHYLPKYVQLHNYIASSSASQKLANWNTLNQKVLKKINMQVSKNDIEHIITASPDVIERVLKITQNKINQHLNKKKEEASQSNIVKEREESMKVIATNKQVKGLVLEKDQTIKQLKETIEILQLKVKKMDQLLKVKDKKIENLIAKLAQAGIS